MKLFSSEAAGSRTAKIFGLVHSAIGLFFLIQAGVICWAKAGAGSGVRERVLQSGLLFYSGFGGLLLVAGVLLRLRSVLGLYASNVVCGLLLVMNLSVVVQSWRRLDSASWFWGLLLGGYPLLALIFLNLRGMKTGLRQQSM